MILKDILNYFKLDIELPAYLYEESFNDVFLEGILVRKENAYEITIKTRKDVIHTMIINPLDDYPLTIISTLPNGKSNGTKFGKTKDDLKFI